MTTDPKPLNRVEVWVAERAVPIFIFLAVAIIAAAGLVFWTWQKSGDAQSQVKVLKPQVTRINRAICDERSLESEARARRCAERIRVGLVNCRRVDRCRAAFLAVLTYPPPARKSAPSSTTAITTAPSSKGVVPQQPSNNGHQQPSPGDPGHHGGDQGQDEGQGQEPAPAASPGPSPAPGGSAAPEASQPGETPGNGAQDGSTSGADVEVCALERTCVGLEVDVDPKGTP